MGNLVVITGQVKNKKIYLLQNKNVFTYAEWFDELDDVAASECYRRAYREDLHASCLLNDYQEYLEMQIIQAFTHKQINLHPSLAEELVNSAKKPAIGEGTIELAVDMATDQIVAFHPESNRWVRVADRNAQTTFDRGKLNFILVSTFTVFASIVLLWQIHRSEQKKRRRHRL